MSLEVWFLNLAMYSQIKEIPKTWASLAQVTFFYPTCFPKNIQESCNTLRESIHLDSKHNQEVRFMVMDLERTTPWERMM